jgi:serine/threonine protein kinase
MDALVYCHKMGVVHKDIRLENLQLTTADVNTAGIKISNIYLVKYLQCEEPIRSTLLPDEDPLRTFKNDLCENIGYRAPESLLLSKR